ncbi:MAG TPA: Nif3-like dinuclear metal center hexameric protein [Pirellulales bacterium]|jgi:dinuclear metal center YbgI/SA1388 family protein
MITVFTVASFLDQFAPRRLAADWDNVGLLVGDGHQAVERIMTCLTVTPASVAEAVAEKVQLIVTHHPLMFRPIQRLTADTTEGKMLLDLARGGVAVYSPHTAFDSARAGINQRLALALELSDISPILADADDSSLGVGRYGYPNRGATIAQIADQLKKFLQLPAVRLVGDASATVRSVAIACGSGGDFLRTAHRAGCDCFVTGEATFHTCLEAEALGVGLLLTGHFASERFAVEQLAEVLAAEFRTAKVWASRAERDPLQVI